MWHNFSTTKSYNTCGIKLVLRSSFLFLKMWPPQSHMDHLQPSDRTTGCSSWKSCTLQHLHGAPHCNGKEALGDAVWTMLHPCLYHHAPFDELMPTGLFTSTLDSLRLHFLMLARACFPQAAFWAFCTEDFSMTPDTPITLKLSVKPLTQPTESLLPLECLTSPAPHCNSKDTWSPPASTL
jgi:hypothetical protein